MRIIALVLLSMRITEELFELVNSILQMFCIR
nr:MAG TPA: hypothetical protein [Caudoviricetes sp.]